MTAKITTDPLTENYQQAGLRVYQDDDNWASIHMIYAGGCRDFEFIYENNSIPRNEAADKLGGIPADDPLTYWVKLISDGSTLRRSTATTATSSTPSAGPPTSPAGRRRRSARSRCPTRRRATRSRASTGSASTRIRRVAAVAAAARRPSCSPTSSTAPTSAPAGTSSAANQA